MALVGPNGAGKSTLLRAIAGSSNRPRASWSSRGSPLAGLDRLAVARRLAVVPQLPSLPFATTVEEVVALGRLPARAPDPRPPAGRPSRDRRGDRSCRRRAPARPGRPRALARRASARAARDGRRPGRADPRPRRADGPPRPPAPGRGHGAPRRPERARRHDDHLGPARHRARRALLPACRRARTRAAWSPTARRSMSLTRRSDSRGLRRRSVPGPAARQPPGLRVV